MILKHCAMKCREIYVLVPWIRHGFLGKNRRWIDANSFTLKEPTLGQDLRWFVLDLSSWWFFNRKKPIFHHHRVKGTPSKWAFLWFVSRSFCLDLFSWVMLFLGILPSQKKTPWNKPPFIGRIWCFSGKSTIFHRKSSSNSPIIWGEYGLQIPSIKRVVNPSQRGIKEIWTFRKDLSFAQFGGSW